MPKLVRPRFFACKSNYSTKNEKTGRMQMHLHTANIFGRHETLAPRARGQQKISAGEVV
jgi:hypothetical protein